MTMREQIDLRPTNEKIARLEAEVERLKACIADGDLLAQRFADGDTLYSRDEVPMGLHGLVKKLHREQREVWRLRPLESAFDRACRLIADFRGDCPTGIKYDWEGCLQDDCDHNRVECYKAYFLGRDRIKMPTPLPLSVTEEE